MDHYIVVDQAQVTEVWNPKLTTLHNSLWVYGV